MTRLRALALLVFALPSAGCSYMSARARDFGDMWKLNAELGVLGLEADVRVGELIHIGVGQKGYTRYGTTYLMDPESPDWAEIYPPVSLFMGLGREPFALHYVHALGDVRSPYIWWWHPYQSVEDRCWIVMPPFTSTGGRSRTPWHWFDLEVSAFVLVFGIEFGFSFGEFVDWFLGWFGLDPADDDTPEGREKRRLYRLPPVEPEP